MLRLIQPKRLDWQRLIFDIERTGLHACEVAFAVNVAPSTIAYLKRMPAAEPRYALGEALRELLRSRTEGTQVLGFGQVAKLFSN